MPLHNPGCLGNYDFERICLFARKRFIDGQPTIELMNQATCDREREEIALVSMLDVDEDVIRNLKLSCRHAKACELTNCRSLIKSLIEDALAGERG